MNKISYGPFLQFYRESPTIIKTVIGNILKPIPRSFLLGSGFKEKLQFLKESEKWKTDELVKYQEQRLSLLIKHSYENVSYYHELFKSNGIYPDDIKKIKDLKKIPILTKDIIRENKQKLLSKNYSKFSPSQAQTSGTTGVPLVFYLDQQNREMEYAQMWRQIQWSGIKNVNIKIASFRGDFVFEPDSNKICRTNGLQKELTFNTYNLLDSQIKKIIIKLNKYKPELIKGFPHALFLISKYAVENDLDITFHPKIIQTSSEQLNNEMREIIEQYFESKIFDRYAQSEYVISFGQCEYGVYHQFMESGIISFIEDRYGFERLIGTGLWNYSMPFINYDVEDIIKSCNDSCQCNCNRGLSVIEDFQGRAEDIIKTPDGRGISSAGFTHYWKHKILPKLSTSPDYVHFIQEKTNKLLVELHLKDKNKKDIEYIKNQLINLIGIESDIEIILLDEVPLKLKKWRMVESKI